MFYIDEFRTTLACINNAKDSIERHHLAIARENRDIELLTEQQAQIQSKLIEMKDEFIKNFAVMYQNTHIPKVLIRYEKDRTNVYLNFLEKDYHLFSFNHSFAGVPSEMNIYQAGFVYNYINSDSFKINEKVNELSDLYSKYEVNPDFVKGQILKVYNGIKINELNNLIQSRKVDLSSSQQSLDRIQSQLSNEVVKPTLFNKIFHKKQLKLQKQEIQLDANITHWKDEISKFQQEIAAITENPEKNLDFVESNLQALSEFLDIYELVKTTRSNIGYKQSEINQIDEKINTKRSWINKHNQYIENFNTIIANANKEIEEICARLSKDKFTFQELCKIADNESVKKLLEHYEAYIASSIEKTI